MTDRGRRWAIAGTALVVVVVGLLAEWIAHGTRLDFGAQRDLLTGWTLAGCGLVAWAAVPRSRIGLLLVAAGLTWFIWNAGSVPQAEWLALALTDLCAGILAHALFTWPTGRAERPLDRALVAAGYVVALFPPLWERDTSLVLVAALLATGLIAQEVTRSPRDRRVRRPVVLLGLGLAAILAAKGIVASTLRQAGVAYPGSSSELWQIAVVVVAIGLTWALIAIDRRRRDATDLVVRLGERTPVVDAAALAEAAGLADDVAVQDALARASHMAARNASLRDELAAQVVALEESRRRLVEAGDDERAALEQRLRSGAAARLARLEGTLAEHYASVARAAPVAASRVDRAIEQLRLARVELSELASGLDPALLRERGLEAALRELAQRSPVPVEVSLRTPASVAPTVGRTTFYVASEALANIAKHSEAARAWLRVEVDGSVLALTVEDDGSGIGDDRMGSGLRGLHDRLDALGGTLEVGPRQAGGTRLAVSIPFGTGALGR